MTNMDKLAKALVDSTEIKDKKKTSAYDATAKVVKVEGKTAWVNIQGGIDQTPARMVVNAKVGEEVRVRVANGSAYVTGNATSPPTDDSYAKKAEAQAIRATRAADAAVREAETAHRAADSAVIDAGIAHEAANDALEDAGIARESAESAVIDAGIAREQAESAVASAGRAETAATEAEARSEAAETSANEAKVSAGNAEISAGEAKGSASEAQKSADKAVYHLEEVENVLDVLGWLSEHATYTLTNDTVITEGKWYFVEDENGNYVVGSPESNPHDEGFYEASADETVTNYIATHLYLDNDGLYVRMDKDGGAKIKITGTGIDLINEYGDTIASYTNYVRLGNADGVHITLSPTNGLGFYQGEEDDNDPSVNRVAYINENKLYITQAELTDSLRIGNFIWKIRTKNTLGDRISFRYEPLTVPTPTQEEE